MIGIIEKISLTAMVITVMGCLSWMFAMAEAEASRIPTIAKVAVYGGSMAAFLTIIIMIWL